MTGTRIVFYGFAIALFHYLWGIDKYDPEKLDSAFNLLVMIGIALVGFYATDKMKATEDS